MTRVPSRHLYSDLWWIKVPKRNLTPSVYSFWINVRVSRHSNLISATLSGSNYGLEPLGRNKTSLSSSGESPSQHKDTKSLSLDHFIPFPPSHNHRPQPRLWNRRYNFFSPTQDRDRLKTVDSSTETPLVITSTHHDLLFTYKSRPRPLPLFSILNDT